jgi:hypothetical protein
LTDYDAAVALTSYNAYTLRLTESLEPLVPKSWTRVSITQEAAEQHVVLAKMRQFQARGENVIDVKMKLTEPQSGQLTRLMDEHKTAERDNRFEWAWVEISLVDWAGQLINLSPPKNQGLVIGGAMPGPPPPPLPPVARAGGAQVVHCIAKRSLKRECKPLEVYNSLMRKADTPVPRLPLPPPVPFVPVKIPVGKGKKKGRYDSESESDSDCSYATTMTWSSGGSVGVVRRRLRRYRARKARGSGKKYFSGSDSESESEREREREEDVITVKVEIKRGEDVVKRLLDLWTPETQAEGKGKGKMV